MKKIIIALLLILSLSACGNDDLDNRIDLENDLAQASLKIEALTESLEDGKLEIGALKEEIRALKNTIKDKDKLIGQLEETLGQVPVEISMNDIQPHILEQTYEQMALLLDEARLYYPDYGYVNFRLESLEYVKSFENINKKDVTLYRLNYKLKTIKPDNIILAGPMYITDDHWVLVSYPNATYLVFEDDMEFLTTIMINDAQPDMTIFKEDLLKKLKTLE